MITRLLSGWVVVLDLDDTLYKEADYVLSGIRAVTGQIDAIYGSSLGTRLVDAWEGGTKDIWGLACTLLGLPLQAKESMLWMYRLHVPTISLDPKVGDWLAGLRGRNAMPVILTDGRSVTQRLKLKALGLLDLAIYISEEYGSEKPTPVRFEKIMGHWPGQHYVYVGDNTHKDFIAPNHLGWLTIGLLDHDRNVHHQNLECGPENAPKYWVESLNEVDKYLY